MVFKLEFISDKQIINEEPACYGMITAGDFSERLVSALTYWQQEDYQNQWNQALRRFVEGKKDTCFITYLRDPKIYGCMEWWILYHRGETAYLQNQLLFFKQLKSPFNPLDPYPHIQERITVNEEGQAISEWSVSTREVEDFFTKQNI